MVSEADPWSWSLDSVIAVLGAVGTVLLAWFALAQTRRANRLEAEARARAERAAMTGAVDVYLSEWRPADQAQRHETFIDVHQRFHDSAAAVSAEGPSIARWVVDAVGDTDRANLAKRVRRAGQPRAESEREAWLLALRVNVKGRIRRWVTTGDLDRSPIYDASDSA